MDERPSGQAFEGVAFVLDLRERVRLRSLRDEAFAREQRARVDAEQANERLTLLAEASKRLARTLRTSDALTALAGAVVPALADWSFIVQRGANEDLRCVAIAHGEPSKAALARRLEQGVIDPSAPEGPARVFRSGETALLRRCRRRAAIAPLARSPWWACAIRSGSSLSGSSARAPCCACRFEVVTRSTPCWSSWVRPPPGATTVTRRCWRWSSRTAPH